MEKGNQQKVGTAFSHTQSAFSVVTTMLFCITDLASLAIPCSKNDTHIYKGNIQRDRYNLCEQRGSSEEMKRIVLFAKIRVQRLFSSLCLEVGLFSWKGHLFLSEPLLFLFGENFFLFKRPPFSAPSLLIIQNDYARGRFSCRRGEREKKLCVH